MLENFASQLKGKSHNAALIEGTDTATGQNFGLLTSLRAKRQSSLMRTDNRTNTPIQGTQRGDDIAEATTSVSKHMIADLSVFGGAKDITLVGAHFKSRINKEESCAQRKGQARVM